MMPASFDEDGELNAYFDSSLVALMIELDGSLEDRLATLKGENSNLLYQNSDTYEGDLIHLFRLKIQSHYLLKSCYVIKVSLMKKIYL